MDGNLSLSVGEITLTLMILSTFSSKERLT